MVSTATQQAAGAIAAFSRMREGILLILAAWVLLGVGSLSLVATVLLSVFGLENVGFTSAAPGIILLTLVLLVVGAIVGIVGFYFKFIPGVSELARTDPRFSTARTLIKVGYVWGLILVIVGTPLLLVLVGLFVLAIGFVLLLLGYIGIIVLSFKLNEAYPNTLYIVAAVLFIVSIVFPLAGVVSWVLLYVALGDTIGKLRAQVT
ncbi:MAG: DUF973 family protein [Sulfolobales archaeon]|nr:DUF973 family protein [Sulfolobales archaeon]MCX8208496.1 DUF973 family protein [Sulfolobales archaeon]MDW8010025.1 DUF973 family protein [Sulfolobales archaeon]